MLGNCPYCAFRLDRCKCSKSGNHVEKQWGSYRVLHESEGYKIKELTILPGKEMSNQRHFKRDEQWVVIKGTLTLSLEDSTQSYEMELKEKGSVNIPATIWHLPENKTEEEVVVLEVWIGDSTENDIERKVLPCS